MRLRYVGIIALLCWVAGFLFHLGISDDTVVVKDATIGYEEQWQPLIQTDSLGNRDTVRTVAGEVVAFKGRRVVVDSVFLEISGELYTLKVPDTLHR